MTTEYKITLDPATPEAQQDKTADASQNRDTRGLKNANFVPTSHNKTAAAQAASAHTPLTPLSRAILEETLKQTAAERDRLERDATYLRETKHQWMRECDQAREQVKTLLAVAQAFTATIFSENENPQQMLRELVQFKRQFRTAIASVESEEAK